jgi:hypothetical protein
VELTKRSTMMRIFGGTLSSYYQGAVAVLTFK